MRSLQRAFIIVLCLSLGSIAAYGQNALPSILSDSADTLPQKIDNGEFCRMIAEFSEPSAKFPFQLMSNEIRYQTVIPKLKASIAAAGVYLGVGPEQNFTYIAALKPKIAFIIDIRRENMIEHLVYKSIFEMSGSRTEFVSRLFSRQVPLKLGDAPKARELFEAYGQTVGDAKLFDRNLRSIKDYLTKDLGFPLTESDATSIDTIYRAFSDSGPGFFDRGQIPLRVSGATVTRIYADLMSATDDNGHAWGYLDSDESFRFVREMELKNLIIPVVGDFAGPKALAMIGRYLTDRTAEVSVFYISNVEDYLFSPSEAWRQFYSILSGLPLTSNATIIRSRGSDSGPPSPPGTRFATMSGSAKELIEAFEAGQIRTHQDVLQMSQP